MTPAALPDAPRRQALSRALLNWYSAHGRDLPWRRSRDPYAIWVSEVMLQQTQVATVVPYFERWMRRFPTVLSLATASEDDVLQSWQGLGYYSRARRLLKGARMVVQDHAGAVPKRTEELQSLPGIGRYSAGAIASIAFGVPAPIVDGNVVRVLTRLQALRGDPSKQPLSGVLWSLAEALIPKASPGDFNQALMELGASLCSPRNPQCKACPWSEMCRAHAQKVTAELPELPVRIKPTNLLMAAAIVTRDGRYLLVRAAKGARRWSGLWMFPTVEYSARETAAAAAVRALAEVVGVKASASSSALVIRHSVTRYRVTLEAIRCRLPARSRPRAIDCSDITWVEPEGLSQLALPAPQRRVAVALGNGTPPPGTSPPSH